MTTLFRHHVRMLARPLRLTMVTLLAALPAVIVLVAGLTEGMVGDEVTAVVSGIGSTTFPIAALLLSAATLRDERDDGTLPYIYVTPIERGTLAATSIAAGTVVTALVGLAAAFLVVGAAAVIGVDLSSGWAALPAFVVAAAGYGPLFVAAGYLVPRVILVGLAYVIIWEQIVARLVPGVANTSVWRFAMSVYADLVPGTNEALRQNLGPVAPGVGGGVLKVAIVGLLGWVLLTWALRRRDAL